MEDCNNCDEAEDLNEEGDDNSYALFSKKDDKEGFGTVYINKESNFYNEVNRDKRRTKNF